jgi:hypothetical protein
MGAGAPTNQGDGKRLHHSAELHCHDGIAACRRRKSQAARPGNGKIQIATSNNIETA